MRENEETETSREERRERLTWKDSYREGRFSEEEGGIRIQRDENDPKVEEKRN